MIVRDAQQASVDDFNKHGCRW